MTDGRRFLDDLAPGDRFESGTHVIDAAQIIAFARDYDPQPFHTDPEAALNTFFGGLAASGWHTAAITMRLLVDSLKLGDGIIGGGGELQWPKPVRPGDTLRVEAEVLEVVPSRSKPDRGAALFRMTTRNQHGEAVMVFTVRVVVPRRPSA